MTVKYTSVIKWIDESHAGFPKLSDERNLYLIDMVIDGKTEGDLDYLGDATFARDFFTREAAQEYIDMVCRLAKKYDQIILSTHIEER